MPLAIPNKDGNFLNFFSFDRVSRKLKEGEAMIIKSCPFISFVKSEEIEIFEGILTPGNFSFSLNRDSFEESSRLSYQKLISDFLLKTIPKAVPQAPGSKTKIFMWTRGELNPLLLHAMEACCRYTTGPSAPGRNWTPNFSLRTGLFYPLNYRGN